jgi:hypothetical protein
MDVDQPLVKCPMMLLLLAARARARAVPAKTDTLWRLDQPRLHLGETRHVPATHEHVRVVHPARPKEAIAVDHVARGLVVLDPGDAVELPIVWIDEHVADSCALVLGRLAWTLISRQLRVRMIMRLWNEDSQLVDQHHVHHADQRLYEAYIPWRGAAGEASRGRASAPSSSYHLWLGQTPCGVRHAHHHHAHARRQACPRRLTKATNCHKPGPGLRH